MFPLIRADKGVPELYEMKFRLSIMEKFCSCKDNEVLNELPGEMVMFPAQEGFHDRLDK